MYKIYNIPFNRHLAHDSLAVLNEKCKIHCRTSLYRYKNKIKWLIAKISNKYLQMNICDNNYPALIRTDVVLKLTEISSTKS